MAVLCELATPEPVLSEILRSLPLRYAQGFGSSLRMTESEGARIDTPPVK